jgi:hypothetical protein
MRLSKIVLSDLTKIRVEVFEASRITTKFWNDRRGPKEPRFFCGWYWYTQRDPNAINGPFKTVSAAHRDAYVRLVMRVNTMIDAGNVSSAPMKAKGGR